MQAAHPHGKIKTNGINGSPASYLDVPHPGTLPPRPRSASPTLGGEQEEGERKEQGKSTKKHKGKSHFSMFRLHKHKKSKKYLKENEEAAMLSHSDGSALLKQGLHQRGVQRNRRSFTGHSNRSISPAGSTHSFQGYMESEGESDDEFLKTLMNPTSQMGRSASPSPLLMRMPSPYQLNGGLESDGGHSGTGQGAKDQGGIYGGGGGGDTVSLTASHLEGSNPVSVYTELSYHIKEIFTFRSS